MFSTQADYIFNLRWSIKGQPGWSLGPPSIYTCSLKFNHGYLCYLTHMQDLRVWPVQSYWPSTNGIITTETTDRQFAQSFFIFFSKTTRIPSKGQGHLGKHPKRENLVVKETCIPILFSKYSLDRCITSTVLLSCLHTVHISFTFFLTIIVMYYNSVFFSGHKQHTLKCL